MTLLDLGLVTRSLITLLRESITVSPAWLSGATLSVLPEPPDRLAGDNVLGFYLYHINEDVHFKNLPASGNNPVPVRYTPMGLDLFYQLASHCDAEDAEGTFREQLMVGLAMKALRDVPVIDDAVTVNGVQVLDSRLLGGDNRLRITLQPLTYEQAVQYWTAGTSALRLAVYYQVSVALLEPEEVSSRAGQVLDYGIFTFTAGAPRLEGSRNTLTYTIPGVAGMREIELRPAQAPIGGRVTFSGVGLAGDQVSLLLKNLRWPDLVEVDPSWAPAATGDSLAVIVGATAGGRDILPGVYSALAKVMRLRPAPGGETRAFDFISNESPFLIAPRIDGISASTPSGEVTVTGAIFQHAELPAGSVQVYAGEARLAEVPGPALNLGEFRVVAAATLGLRLPGGLVSGQFVPLRLLVNGAESPPNWVRVP
jgi:Pvc16 N-terminal domain